MADKKSSEEIVAEATQEQEMDSGAVVINRWNANPPPKKTPEQIAERERKDAKMWEEEKRIKTPAEIDKKNEENIANLTGYRDSDYLWFGDSAPEIIVYKCLMCDHIHRLAREEILTGNFPEICTDCRRRSLKLISGKESVWNHYVKLKLWKHNLFLDQYNEAFTQYNNGTKRILQIGGEDMQRILTIKCKNPNQVRDAQMIMAALAARGKQVIPLHNRIAEKDGAIWIDCSTKQGEAIRITPEGWEVVEYPPILFRHFSHQQPFLADKSGTKEDFDRYLDLMKFASVEDRTLFAGYAASLFHPGFAHPILMPVGPQGSAKSTISVMAKLLIDPSTLLEQKLKRDEEALPQVFFQHYMPVFDNCNYISQEMTDMFCIACTGAGFSKRKHYTNSEEVIYTFKRPFVLNGLCPPSQQGDLVERSIIVRLDKIPETMMLPYSVVEARRDALLPKVRGYLMGIAADVLGMEEVEFPSLPRMADFARIAELSCRAMGQPDGSFLNLYLNTARENEQEALRSDVLADALLSYLALKGSWDGGATKLKKELEGMEGVNTKSPTWPKDSARLADRLFGVLRPGLVRLGWNVVKSKSSGVRTIQIWRDVVVEGGLMDEKGQKGAERDSKGQ
jgi:hypothetical protein